MLANKILSRMLFSTANQVPVRAPKAPKLLHGQLQTFRFDAQNSRIYDGYTLDQLYGSKLGVKHPPSIRAQMTKDSIASLALFIIGFGIILHTSWLGKEQVKQLKALNLGRQRRQSKLPEGLISPLKVL